MDDLKKYGVHITSFYLGEARRIFNIQVYDFINKNKFVGYSTDRDKLIDLHHTEFIVNEKIYYINKKTFLKLLHTNVNVIIGSKEKDFFKLIGAYEELI
jgi:hypothetical protein